VEAARTFFNDKNSSRNLDIHPLATTCSGSAYERAQCGNRLAIFADQSPCHCGVASDIDDAATWVELLTLKLQGVWISRQNLQDIFRKIFCCG
jgi:hypothetical protein